MGKVIFVTSFKGGTGKTAVCANLSSILARMDCKVLAIDGDLGMRCLDMALGLESESIYNIADVISGACSDRDAIVESESIAGLGFIPAPMETADFFPSPESVKETINRFKNQYDYVIIDSCAEETAYYRLFALASDSAIVVSSHQSLSVRAAGKTGLRLEQMGLTDIRLVINFYRKELSECGILPSVYNIINDSAIQLLGVIPYDENVCVDQEKGVTAFGTDDKFASPYEAALYNIASRISGKSIPLFTKVFDNTKRKHFTLIRD